MDITSLFKASVKTVRLKSSANSFQVADKSRILTKRLNSEFSERAKKIRFQITQLKNLLVENRAAYMQFAYHLKNSAQMTNEERDIIDRESENIIQLCTAMLNDFKADCRKSNRSKQISEFMDLVIEALSNYMSAVHQIANEQRQFRLQRELETYKYLKLNSDRKSLAVIPKQLLNGSINGAEKHRKTDDKRVTLHDEEVDEVSGRLEYSKSMIVSQDVELANSSSFLEDEELSPEDIQIFESENVQLYNELKGLSEEVEQIERNVVDIAQLQEIFTEKISLQKTDIERIANTVVGATENVKDANEQIKQAIQRNAGLRVWVLFFLIVMSLTLLFLDWYND
ncbi:syntaxin-18 [Topomyia yanbarensis]|uniref:syntaxin-18 n=1 Tax=Topomyia yanbarensis TaxID=2498891 RepID=UPI00273AD05F|nr:syntaxin-18 [Topomyia yanbarensis]XP_058829280.1 syntaxin-18 [Topomyia yanbarensis]XP_058829281.1 syntaxin-18 [Topomyia yanbarensis]